MNKTGFTISARMNTVLWCLAGAVFIWALVGTFPLSGIEGDDYGIAAGVLQMKADGPGPNPVAYRYDVQSGSYIVLYWLHSVTGIEPIPLFCMMTAIAGMVFIVLCTAVVSRITNAPASLCALAVLIFPETWSGMYYGNTTTLSGAFIALAYLLLLRQSTWSAIAFGCLMGIAAWFRFDALLFTPAVVILLYNTGWRKTIILTGIAAVFTVGTVYLLMWMSDASIVEVFVQTEQHRRGGLGVKDNLLSLTAFVGPDLILFLTVGVIAAVRTRNLRILGLAACGILFVALAYKDELASPKYLYNTVPFLAPLVICSFTVLSRLPRQRLVRTGIAVLIAVSWGVGLDYAAFPAEDGMQYDLTVSLGSGKVHDCNDGPRLVTARLFTPWTWRSVKTQEIERMELERRAVENLDPECRVIRAGGWRQVEQMKYLLLTAGYRHLSRSRRPRYSPRSYWRFGSRTPITLSGAVGRHGLPRAPVVLPEPEM